MAFQHANPSILLMLLAFSGLILVFILRARSGKISFIRKIPGLSAIDEAVGRATEMGRPICFSTGLAAIEMVTMAALSILYHVARLSARYENRVFVPMYSPEVLPIAVEICKEAYREEGKLDQFNPDDVRFFSNQQFAYASATMGLMHREKVASNFMFGNFAAESLILAEAGQQVGAIQVAGTTSFHQIPFFITTCDYTIIGEELFAASAYLTKQPTALGSLIGQDMSKMIIFATVVLGVVFATWYANDSYMDNPITKVITWSWKW